MAKSPRDFLPDVDAIADHIENLLDHEMHSDLNETVNGQACMVLNIQTTEPLSPDVIEKVCKRYINVGWGDCKIVEFSADKYSTVYRVILTYP